jgi:hypothetical protein
MPKAPPISPKSEQEQLSTFLEYVIERYLGPPAYRGVDYSMWLCPFHNDHKPSFATRPHKKEFKDRWTCYGCGERGDELDFLKLYHPKEDYNARLERLRKLWREYDAMQKAVAISHRGSGSTAGVTILRSLIRAGKVDHCDLLEVVSELKHRRQLRMEWKQLRRRRKAA